jgi:2-polyprenyl-3-methyl-5-hydroxy-6-metoxy-1,4-benzoquinol methylase
MDFEQDPIGLAISDFIQKKETPDITVHSDLCDDDFMPVPYLFRSFENMPPIEKRALDLCEGKVLDVGAGAGCHSIYLKNKKIDIESIDTSKGAVDYLSSINIKSEHSEFLQYNNRSFDTILLLMNGIGIAGTLKQLSSFLNHAKTLLKPNGQILCDSTDISYMYTDDEGGKWMDLASEYYGEMQFKMVYKYAETEWFPWLYIDFNTLEKTAKTVGLNAEMVIDSENDQYLARLTFI